MYTVMQLRGKGSGRADYVSIHQFDNITEASQFVIANTKPEDKYWSVASLIDAEGEEYETGKEALL